MERLVQKEADYKIKDKAGVHETIFLIILCTKLEVSWFLTYFGPFSFYQMTPLHSAGESNDVKMVKCLLDQAADIINLQDKNEVILHTNAVARLL